MGSSKRPHPAGRKLGRRWRPIVLAGVAVLSAAAVAAAVAPPLPPGAPAAPSGGVSPTLAAAPQWFNTPPLRPEDLRGKVVVVNFWTYSCINSLRALPYLRAWSAKYGGRGLVVVGVHTPEFAFEKDAANVRKATADLGVDFPVVLDSDGRIWRAFGNNAWPAFYFVGADGKVRRHVIGEGGYDQSERLIQKLLAETPGPPVPDGVSAVTGTGPEAPADARDLGSGETYIGYARASDFAGPGGLRRDAPHRYRAPVALPRNRWGLAGEWTLGPEYAALATPGGRIVRRFHARDLHMVLAPSASGHPVRFRIRIDGAPPGADHGSDVAADGSGVVREPRMYQLVRQTRPVADRTFEIEFLDPGVRAYVFTFG